MGFATYALQVFHLTGERRTALVRQSKTICNLFELNICHFVGTNATRAQPTKFKR